MGKGSEREMCEMCEMCEAPRESRMGQSGDFGVPRILAKSRCHMHRNADILFVVTDKAAS